MRETKQQTVPSNHCMSAVLKSVISLFFLEPVTTPDDWGWDVKGLDHSGKV